jgi:hypothetical protein
MIINSVMALPNGMFRVTLSGGEVHDTFYNAKDEIGEALRTWEKAGNRPSSYVATIEDIREKTSIEKSSFCILLAQNGVLSNEEAVIAARGDWPASFADALTQMGADSLEAQIKWATATDISRNEPLILLLAQFKGLTDEAVDTLFGINA